MAVECIILAVPLVVFSTLLSREAAARDAITADSAAMQANLRSIEPAAAPEITQTSAGTQINPAGQTPRKIPLLVKIVTGIGAGIYEEFVFRLVLICLLMLLLQDFFSLNYTVSVTLAVVVSAVLFSAHHHILFLSGGFKSGEAFAWWAFVFRTVAGLYFAALFALRGFGITAGTHALYDIIAALLNAVLSAPQS